VNPDCAGASHRISHPTIVSHSRDAGHESCWPGDASAVIPHRSLGLEVALAGKVELFGVPVDLLTIDETVARCRELIEQRRPVQHAFINAAETVMMEDVPGFRATLAACDIVNADGQSIIWAARLLGVALPGRVAGPDLMERLLELAEHQGYPVYFLGAKAEVLVDFEAAVVKLHPRLTIAGRHHGYFDDDEAVADEIRNSGARLLFVAISSPRKEFFLSRNLERIGPVFTMGVGGSFDLLAGVTRRAPRWMQDAGLEWFFRLMQEPRRMWKRYLIGNARFLGLTLRAWWHS
jgi:N-acetylglucosaminyldiphosphoundecaprenol N-acetyl-beta-D-mannosaminyltransferase